MPTKRKSHTCIYTYKAGHVQNNNYSTTCISKFELLFLYPVGT